MTMFRNIIYFLFLIVLFSCTTDRQGNVKESDFIGLWHSIKREIPYGATLQINEDNTFKFQYGACMIKGGSVGKWIINDNCLILNSNDNVDTCILTQNFGDNCVEVQFDSTVINESIQKKECAPGDTYFVIFDSSNFIMRHDSLIYLTKGRNLCSQIKDIFVKR